MSETYRDTDDPIKALGDCLAFNSRDWAGNKADAWIYGIVLGWDDDHPETDAMAEVAAEVGWDEYDVARLRRLHARWVLLEEAFRGT